MLSSLLFCLEYGAGGLACGVGEGSDQTRPADHVHRPRQPCPASHTCENSAEPDEQSTHARCESAHKHSLSAHSDLLCSTLPSLTGRPVRSGRAGRSAARRCPCQQGNERPHRSRRREKPQRVAPPWLSLVESVDTETNIMACRVSLHSTLYYIAKHL